MITPLLKRVLLMQFLLFSFNIFADVPTKIIFLRPYDNQGMLDSSFIVAQHVTGFCPAKSIANSGRTNTWRCQANNLIMDPCFQDKTSVACLSSPWTKKVSIIEFNNHLPKAAPDTVNLTSLPWAVELNNSQRCILMTGENTVIDGMRVIYVCNDERFTIMKLNKTTQSWVAHLYNSDSHTAQDINVTTAWY